MSLDDRLQSLSDARYHAQELVKSLKQLGCRYLNNIDVIGDIDTSLSIDESLTEQEYIRYCERETRALLKEYYQTT